MGAMRATDRNQGTDTGGMAGRELQANQRTVRIADKAVQTRDTQRIQQGGDRIDAILATALRITGETA